MNKHAVLYGQIIGSITRGYATMYVRILTYIYAYTPLRMYNYDITQIKQNIQMNCVLVHT